MNTTAIFGQLMLGLINGSFYAVLSLGMALVFGVLHIVNFAHGALYMLGAFTAYLSLQYLGLPFWSALLVGPAVVGAIGILVERTMLVRLRTLDPVYGFLLTFGLTLVVEGMFRYWFGASSRPYPVPALLRGGTSIAGVFVPYYRLWIVAASLVLCLATWFFLERTRLGGYLRAATENAKLVQVFGINVPVLITLTFGAASGLAALAGVLAAPVYQVSPLMGSRLLILVFGIVVIGGMGSIRGAIVAGYSLGIVEGLTKVVYPEGSYIVIFVVMAIVLLVRPQRHVAREIEETGSAPFGARRIGHRVDWSTLAGSLAVVALLIVAPFFIYPVFLMKLMCYALFAATFNLLFGYVGLLSFGHAAFLGTGAYLTAQAAKVWGLGTVPSLIVATAAAGLVGAAVGSLAIRRRGIEFAMITLAFAEMISFVANRAPFTGGENGLQDVPRGTFLGLFDLDSTVSIYGFTLLVFAAGMFVLWRTVNSPFGHVLQAIRDHEPRAVSLGYDVARFKLTAFVISAAIAGLAGGTKAIVFQFAVLDDVSTSMSGEVILMTLLGGLGRFFGPLVGATVVVLLESVLATSPLPAPVVIGGVFIGCVLLFRRGIIGELASRLEARAAR